MEKYMILSVEDAHELARAPNDEIVLTANILDDSGGDIRQIALLLKDDGNLHGVRARKHGAHVRRHHRAATRPTTSTST